MFWYLEALATPIHIDAQKSPLSAIAVFVIFCLLLWFAVGRAKRRDERRARGRDLTEWSSGRPRRPRY